MRSSILERGFSRIVLFAAVAAPVLTAVSLRAGAVSCPVIKHGLPSDADKAILAGEYDKAAGLYQAVLVKQAGDAEATVGLVHALLRQQKVSEAVDAVKDALEAAPKTAALITLRGEVEFRSGEPWLVEPTVVESYKIDPCNPRNRLLFARIAEATSRFATAQQQILLAHQFDPEDPEIRLMWMRTLPAAQRAAELESYLSAPNGNDAATIAMLHGELDRLKAEAAEPTHGCRIASATSTAEIPFIRLAGYAGHARAYGLEVTLNNTTTRLQLDTRGAGISVYRSAVEHAGMKRVGAGDKGAAALKPNYTAVADSVKIGGLEFKDCPVTVIDSANPFEDGSGMIGMDVFADFLVTLDFPMRKLGLGALPARNGEAATAQSLRSNAADFDPLAPRLEPAMVAAAGAVAAPPKPIVPLDRFIAPEMKDYTQIFRVGHDLILPTALGGDKVKLFVPDASLPETNLAPGTALDLPKVHEDKTKEFAGPGGKSARVFVVDEVNFNFAHVSQRLTGVLSADASQASKSDGMEIAGFLGMNTTLINLTLHIDYRDGLLKADYVPGRGTNKME